MDRKMKKPAEKPLEDPDLPEMTAEIFARARPVKDVFPEIIEAAKRARGRPKLDAPKRQISIRLAPEVIEAYRALGPGWQAKVNEDLLRIVSKRTRKRA
jgi:uncharacterized protein (DUF4415 family)